MHVLKRGYTSHRFIIVCIIICLYSANTYYTHALTRLAQTPAIQSTINPTQIPTQSAVEDIIYELPYPGVLPDRPLYPLKIFRDRLLDFLIRDPIKRIEFNVLMADKRIHMGVYLTDKQEYELAEKTVSKGEKYMVRAVDSVYAAKEKGHILSGELIATIMRAIKKHRRVVDELKNKSPEHVQNGYESSLQTISESAGRISEFQP